MKRLLPTLCAAVAIFAASLTPANAQANTGASFSANIGITNNYVWRGLSQTMDDSAVQGGADVELDNGLSAGVWASNVDFGDSTDAEVDIYGGWSFPLTEMVSGSVGAIAYLYPGQPSGAGYNFVEVNGGVDIDLSPITLSGLVAFGPDTLNESTWYFNGSASVAAGEYFELFGGLGWYEWESSTDYLDYIFGVAATWQNFTVSAAYAGTDLASDDGNFVVALTATVP